MFASNREVFSWTSCCLLLLTSGWVSLRALGPVLVSQAPGSGKREVVLTELYYGQAWYPQCCGKVEGRAGPAVAILTLLGASHLPCMCYPVAVPSVW